MRYFLTILGIVIALVVIIVIVARTNTSKSTTAPNLNNYSNSTSNVSETVTGLLTSEENRQAFRITVNQSTRTIDTLTGYEQTVSNTQTYPNTPAAYQVFLQGLQTAGFLSSRATSQPNYFSVCPLGDTFQYEITNSGKSISNLWTTSCFVSGGSFIGNGALINQLFQLQIPNFNNFVVGLKNVPQFYSIY